ncbi:MAG: hypothetical protein IJW16_02550 [Clostridia bacterium]|nr:hypothetical protein [Clostridia bacterium]
MALRVCLLAVTALSLALLVKAWKSDFLPLVRIAAALAFALLLISSATPIISYVEGLIQSTSAAGYSPILFKALGIAILTQCCSEICRECGEGGIATGVELVGKLEILLLCLPLINEILTLARELMELGS